MAGFLCHAFAGTKRFRLERIVRRTTDELESSAPYCGCGVDCCKKSVQPCFLPAPTDHEDVQMQVIAFSDEAAAVNYDEGVGVACDFDRKFMCFRHEEAHDREVDAGMVRIGGLMAEHEAMLAPRHCVRHEATLPLQIARWGGYVSVPDENVQECA